MPRAHDGCAPMSDLHPIVTIRWCGSILIQGPTAEPVDRRGFIRSDMHGRVYVRIGTEVFCGHPIDPVRRPAPHPVSQNIREDREATPPDLGGCDCKGARGIDQCEQ